MISGLVLYVSLYDRMKQEVGGARIPAVFTYADNKLTNKNREVIPIVKPFVAVYFGVGASAVDPPKIIRPLTTTVDAAVGCTLTYDAGSISIAGADVLGDICNANPGFEDWMESMAGDPMAYKLVWDAAFQAGSKLTYTLLTGEHA